MKRHFSIKIYSILIIALLFSARGKAQIVYTDVNPDSVSSGVYNLDLNNDATTDFIISQTVGSPICTHNTHYIRISPTGNNEVLTNSTPYVYKLSSNTVIDTSTNFWSNNANQTMLYYHWQTLMCPGGAYAGQGNWLNAVNGYLGLKLFVNNIPYCGWALLNTSSSASSGIPTFTIQGYAYNSIPGEQIAAGEIGCNLPTPIITPSGSTTL